MKGAGPYGPAFFFIPHLAYGLLVLVAWASNSSARSVIALSICVANALTAASRCNAYRAMAMPSRSVTQGGASAAKSFA